MTFLNWIGLTPTKPNSNSSTHQRVDEASLLNWNEPAQLFQTLPFFARKFPEFLTASLESLAFLVFQRFNFSFFAPFLTTIFLSASQFFSSVRPELSSCSGKRLFFPGTQFFQRLFVFEKRKLRREFFLLVDRFSQNQRDKKCPKSR